MAMPRGQALKGPVREGFLHPYNSFGNRIATLRFVQDIPLKPAHPSWETIGSIQKHLHLLEDKPVLICWGEQDFCFTVTFLKTWRQYFPNAKIHRFPDAGHYLLETAGDRIIPLVADFMNQSAT
jgi:haloalkane dehalogenase